MARDAIGTITRKKEIRNYTHIYAALPASRAEERADAVERAWR